MLRSKRNLAVLGLCAVALGAAVFGTNLVQAESAAFWRVNGVKVTTLNPAVSILSVDSEDMALLTAIGGVPVEILCKGSEFIGATLQAEGKVSSGNKTKFSGCIFKKEGKTLGSCEPEGGAFTSNGLKGLVVLHNKETLIRFEPSSGTVFATVKLGEECASGQSCVISGVSTVKETKGEFGTELITHLVEQGPLSNLTINGGTPATVDGSASLALSGAHEGMKWSAIPG